MALDFPSSPTDGQIYNNYYWDDTGGVWQFLGSKLETTMFTTDTATGSYTDGFDYEYLTFTADGTLTVTRAGLCDILLVGGGGAGGVGYGAGGGAGGMLYVENAYLPSGSLDVVVGAGGLGQTSGTNTGMIGLSGESSSLWEYFTLGGGGAGGFTVSYSSTNVFGQPGQNGGSGGGASGYGSGSAKTGGSGTSGLGNNGAIGVSGTAGGGGGGAGAAGSLASGNIGGDGGDGASNLITGSAVTYAGGGAGGGSSGVGTGGSGGGANGTVNGSAINAVANTGGGGGGTYDSTADTGGDGGSGIVIVRWRV